jgi:hypothetical protein
MDHEDCAPGDGTIWSVPEVHDLTVTASGEMVQLTWPPPFEPGGVAPPVYDTLSSYDASDFGPSAVCEDVHGLDRFTLVGTVLAPGEVLYLLVRGINGCGPGPGGYSSDGFPREPRNCS